MTVPENFVGLSTSDIVAAPSSITFGLVRTWDYRADLGLTRRCVVKNLNPSAGVYNYDVFDKLLDNNPGKQVIFCLGQPADYLVSRSAIGGAYLSGKANMCPDDLATWATVVQDICAHAAARGRTGLVWELWNEIDQTASYADSVALLGPYAKATAQAIRAIDPTAVILSPSCAGFSNRAPVGAFLANTDGAGGTGATWCDGVSFHYYNFTQYGYEHPINYVNAHSAMRSMLTDLGLSLPLWVTESGFPSTAPNIGKRYQHRMLTFAALGCKCFLGYNYDSTAFPVSPYATEWNVVADLLRPGAVISKLVAGVAGLNITIDGMEYTF